MSKLLPLDLFIRQALLYPLDSPFLPPENKVEKGYSYAAGRKTGSLEAIIWDLLAEYCDNIDDWVDWDVSPAVSEVDPAGQFRFDTNLGAAANGRAQRYRDIGSFPNTFTVEVKLFHDAIGTEANVDYFYLQFFQADEGFLVYFSDSKLELRDTDSGFTEVGTNLVKHGGSAEWQTWRFLVTFTGTPGEGICDVYLDDSTHNWEKVGTAIPCSFVGTYTEGRINLIQYGNTTNNMVSHIDYIKIATGLYVP